VIDDTIVAVATPPGRGGIGVVRIAGAEATRIAAGLLACDAPLEPRHATFTTIKSLQRGLRRPIRTPVTTSSRSRRMAAR
jgi:tRNA U34 5-carboxymethylaminomethyl modifying GTPase MnmE/TrmE